MNWLLPNLLDRYIFKQLLDYFILGLVIFSLVAFFSDTLFDFISDVQKYGISTETLLTIIGLQLPRSVAFVIPASCFLAVLIVYNLMNNNFELIAIRMNGISLSRLVRPAVILSIISAIGTYLINDYVVPYCNTQTDALKSAAIANGKLPFSAKGFMFKAYDERHNLTQLIYVGGLNKNQLGNSTIIDLSHRNQSILKTMKIVQAKSGTYDSESGWLFDNANIYYVATNANNSSAGHSDTFHVKQLLSKRGDDETRLERERKREAGLLTDASTQNFFQLLGAIQRREAFAQRQNDPKEGPSRKSYLSLWEKLTLPLSSFAIVLIAVALAIHQPRAGSQRGFITALVVLLVSYMLRSASLALGRSEWIELGGLLSKQTSLFMAAWLPVTLMAVFGIVMLSKRSRTL